MPGSLRIHRTHLDASADPYLTTRIAPEDVAEVRLQRFPPEVMLRDGRIGFVPRPKEHALELFASLHGIPSISREDTWSLLAEPFLDTEHDADWQHRTMERLASLGFDADEVRTIRRFIEPSMLALTFATWEWVHYGLWDVLSAVRVRLLPRWFRGSESLPRLWSSRALRRWAEGIANRAPAHDLASTPPSGEELRRRIEGRWPLPSLKALSGSRYAEIRDGVLEAWSQPHRRHHGVRHLDAVTRALEGAEPNVALGLAAFFHDAVYDPTRTDNEERSAAWLETELAPEIARGAYSEKDVALAARIVRATASPFDLPDPTSTGSGPIYRFIDADFGVFASLPAAYDAYVEGIRREYAHIDDAAFRAGRRSFLERLASEVERRGWFFNDAEPIEESLARENLARELDALR